MFRYTTVLLFGLVLCDLSHIEDLTWDFDNNTIYWTGMTPFTYTKKVAENRGYWYSMNEFCAAEHGGTHFDAPYHFNQEGWKVAEVPITRLVAQGATIDLSHSPTTKSLNVQHLQDWVTRNGPFEDNTVLLVKFGRSQYWPNKTAYMSLDDNGNYNFPGLSEEASKWIVNSRKIVGVGLDTPSVDCGDSTDMIAHRTLSESQIYNVENVKLVVDLPAKGFRVVVLPMKLKDGTGAPARVLAVLKGVFSNSTEGTELSSTTIEGDENCDLFVYQPLVYLVPLQ